MDKPLIKLQRDQAEVIEILREQGYTDRKIIQDALNDSTHALNDMDTYDLASALRFGWEVEQTPEDKVREYYKDQVQRAGSRDGTDHISPAAIRMVLDLLSIKISGINE